MGVSYEELDGWPQSYWDRGDFYGERRLLCAWSDRVSLLNELDADFQWPTSLYPEGPSAALARTARVIPFGRMPLTSSQNYAEYEWAIIQVHYSTKGPKWDAINKLFIEETMDPAFMSFSVDNANLRWKNDDKRVEPNDAPVNHDCLLEYQIAFHFLTSLPTWILARPGLCNSNTFITAGLGISFAPYTIKYMGSSIRGTYSLAKLPRYHVTAKFLFKWSEWNKFWRHDTAAWEYMVNKDGDDYIQHTPVVMNLI